ncbi:FliH/SctL family protein [Vogesella oryzae]|uniref:FliH/SctL family protein n=1 Tax=Vogesella oryzae TaxID=1735285 RepID=UPI001583036F|nr:FliH/SctL family protein [Vogesella oryzae]
MSNNNVIPAEALGQWQSWRFGELGAQAATPQPESPPDKSEPPAEGVSALEPAEDITQELVTDLPSEPAEPEVAPPAYPTAAELEAIHQEAWQAGFDAGREEGLQLGRGEGASQALQEAAARFAEYWQPLSELQSAFEQQLQLLGESLSGDVLTLSVELAERIVAAHIELDRMAILPLLQQALDELGHGLLQAKIKANPEDMAVIQAFVAETHPGVSWQWQADDSVARGGCVIESSQHRLDLGLPQRLQMVRRALGASDD